MTTQARPVGQTAPGARPCTPEEEQELQRLDRELDLNLANRDANLAGLTERHRGQFAMFYCDAHGEPQTAVAESRSLLYDSVERERLQAAIVEFLEAEIQTEIIVPSVFLDVAVD